MDGKNLTEMPGRHSAGMKLKGLLALRIQQIVPGRVKQDTPDDDRERG